MKLKFPLIAFLIVLSACTGQEARKPVQHHSGSFIKESAERNKELYQEEKNEIEALIAKDTLNTYYTSEKGFWYVYNKKIDSITIKPKTGDIVKFTYTIRNLEDQLILSEKDNGIQNYKMDQSNQDLISGIREGLKIMQPGEEVTFFFPSYRAYGYYGIHKKLGTNVPVKSTVKLLSVIPQEDKD